jgi:hypothetical protein
MSRFRSGALLTVMIALSASLMCAAVSSMAQSLPSGVKTLVFVGPNSTRSLTVRGTVTLRPSVPPNVGVTSVVFYLDGNGLGTVKAAPFKLDWDSTTKEDGEYQLKAIGSTESGQEVWTGEGKIIVANKTPAPAPPSPPIPPVMTPAVKRPAPTMMPAVRPAPPTTAPALRPPPATVTVRPTSGVSPKPIIKPVPKPVTPPKPVVVAQVPPKVTAPPKPVMTPTPKPIAAPPKPVAPPSVSATPKHPSVAPPKPVPAVKPASKPLVRPKVMANPKPVAKPAPNPASVAWKTYTNSKYRFTAEYPGTAKVQNESAHMKPNGPGTFWIAFTQTSSGKPWYAINVRHMKTNEPGTPDKFAKYNPYLLSWDRTNVAGLDGFKTVSGRASSKRVIHRTLLVNDRDVWMLNLTDVSGNDSSITGDVFKRFIDSFRPEGAVAGERPVPVAPAPKLNRTGYPTPPRPATVERAPVPPPAPAPEEAPPPPAPDDSGYNSGE